MRFAVIATICFLVFSAGCASGDPVSWFDDPTEPPAAANTTTTSTTPSTTTTEPTTTTTPSTTTTPTTTTTEPTTTSTTTTTEPPPTTTTPRPKPPKAGIWTVVDETTNITCIVVKLGATFIVPYITTNGTVNATLAIPSNATSNGTCLAREGELQAITLNWPSTPESTHVNHFTLVFRKNESKTENADGGSKDQYAVVEMALTAHPDPVNFPDALSGQTIVARLSNVAFHPTNLNNTYTCRSEEEVHLNETSTPVVARLRNVQLEAFRHKTDDSFSTASYCSADGPLTSDIVPIAVGCALAALVVIVLIAYLIGRRRARQRGYQSV